MDWKRWTLYASLGLMAACGGRSSQNDSPQRLASFTVGEYTPNANDPSWQYLQLNMVRNDQANTIERKIDLASYSNGDYQEVSTQVEAGEYRIKLSYFSSNNVLLYQSCKLNPNEIDRPHILKAGQTYRVKIKICNAQTGALSGEVEAKDLASVEITPEAINGTPIPNPAQQQNSGKLVDRHGFLQVRGNRIVDKNAQTIQLRGMSLFWSQWSSEFWNRQIVTTQAKDWKATLIRAAMAVEDGGYLTNPQAEKAKVKTIVDQAIAEGIYVIIDWHDHNATKHQAEAIQFFSEMASLYGQTPNVIFEIYNEPIGQSWEQVKSYAEAVIGAIRSKGAKNLVIVGSPTWSQRVDLAADNPIRDSNVAYTLHFYASTHRQELRDQAEYALRKGIALFVTEFGVCDASGNGAIDLEETERWMQFMDRHQISWANWSLFDKQESASALKPGASKTGPWKAEDLTTSGQYIRRKIAEGRN